MHVARLNELRTRLADSKAAATGYFAVVLIVLVIARTWVNSSGVAYAVVFIFAVPALFTWPLADAAFSRYSRTPTVYAAPRSRMPWVWCVIVGIVFSIAIGGLGS